MLINYVYYINLNLNIKILLVAIKIPSDYHIKKYCKAHINSVKGLT